MNIASAVHRVPDTLPVLTYVWDAVMSHADPAVRDVLRTFFRDQRASTQQVPMYFIRRHHRYLLALPPGSLSGRLASSVAEESQALALALSAVKRAHLKVVACLKPILAHAGDDRYYLRRELVEALAAQPGTNPYFQAVAAFHKAVEAEPRVYFPKPTLARRRWTAEERKMLHNGRDVRGPDWTLADDDVLTRFFGVDPNTGARQKMDEVRWQQCLALLRGRRTRRAVLARISFLNMKLKRSLMIDGYINAEGVKKYKQLKLGQRTRVPNFRPRLPGHGTYHEAAPRRSDETT